MRRREFITLLSGAAAWPLAARAQQTGKLPTIGYLGGATAAAWSPWTAAFVLRLREIGWIEGLPKVRSPHDLDCYASHQWNFLNKTPMEYLTMMSDLPLT